jgi:carboxymethylenebutenolidase
MPYQIKSGLVRIPLQDGNAFMGGYLSAPDPNRLAAAPAPNPLGGPRQFPPVLLGMELFGVNAHIRDIADRIAALGYIVLAADYYYRIEPDCELAFDEEGRSKGMAMLHRLQRQWVLEDVASAIGFLRARPEVQGRIGFVGFSVGGHIAYLAATKLSIDLTVCFYAGWLNNTDIPLSQPEPTVTLTSGIARHDGRLVYFAGGKDHVIDQVQLDILVKAWREAGIRHDLIVYPDTGHGFFCDQRNSFHEPSRDDSWLRLQRLLAEELGKC